MTPKLKVLLYETIPILFSFLFPVFNLRILYQYLDHPWNISGKIWQESFPKVMRYYVINSMRSSHFSKKLRELFFIFGLNNMCNIPKAANCQIRSHKVTFPCFLRNSNFLKNPSWPPSCHRLGQSHRMLSSKG